MTTGRINQVTTFRLCIPKNAMHDTRNTDMLLSRSGVHHHQVNDSIVTSKGNFHTSMCTLTTLEADNQNALFPGLTYFRRLSPCCNTTKIRAFKENYLATGWFVKIQHRGGGFSTSWLRQVQLSASNPQLSTLQAPSREYLTQASKGNTLVFPTCSASVSFPSQCILIDRRIYNSVNDRPAVPFLRHTGHKVVKLVRSTSVYEWPQEDSQAVSTSV